jgi:tetratricopeptide (TPR) repeat protein
MDEAHYAVEISPFYLPVHIRIAELLIAMGDVPQAIAKYNTIVETYLSRNDRQKALQMLDDALKVAPMDITMRVRLLQMLQEDERWEDVLDQRLDLGDTYYQLADLDAARKNYVQAQQLARRINIDNGQLLQIMRRIGDIDVARLNLRQALRIYQQIRDLDPEDENARLTLMDLNYRLNNPIGAIRELDSLLRIYAKEKRIQDIVKVLEEQVTMRSDDIALRRRLASVYRQVGNKPKAVEQLDTLGNLQLDAGLTDDAIETIRQIVQLNPPNVQEYEHLLNNLSSGSTA